MIYQYFFSSIQAHQPRQSKLVCLCVGCSLLAETRDLKIGNPELMSNRVTPMLNGNRILILFYRSFEQQLYLARKAGIVFAGVSGTLHPFFPSEDYLDLVLVSTGFAFQVFQVQLGCSKIRLKTQHLVHLVQNGPKIWDLGRFGRSVGSSEESCLILVAPETLET